MSLSIPSLQFTDLIVFLACGLVFLSGWLLHREKRWFLLFGSSFILCAVMSVGFADFGRYGSWLSPLGWTLAGTLFWTGFRLFDGRRPLTPVMIVLTALPMSLHVGLVAAEQDSETVNTVTTLAYALHEAAVAYYVLSTSRGSTIRKVTGLALVAIAIAICLPLLPLSESFDELTLVAIVVVDHVTSIVLTTAIFGLENEKAYARLEQIAHCDPLTGALNRKGLEREVARCDGGFGVIAADLDHFKQVNDRYGHAAGDHVLQEFVSRARSIMPESALLARCGGEEFVVIVRTGDASAVTFLAERLRFAIQSQPIVWGDHSIPASVSLGVTMTDTATTIAATLERADAVMYEAKVAGRNRVHVA